MIIMINYPTGSPVGNAALSMAGLISRSNGKLKEEVKKKKKRKKETQARKKIKMRKIVKIDLKQKAVRLAQRPSKPEIELSLKAFDQDNVLACQQPRERHIF